MAFPADQIMVLGLLAAGQVGVVDSVLGGSEETHRLRELGLRDGATVEMIQPGTTCLVRLGGQKLGIRSEALFCVMVRARQTA